MDNLIQYLKVHPKIKTVYFNSAGQWIFSPNRQFPIAKSAGDLLAEHDNAPTDAQIASITEQNAADKKAADDTKKSDAADAADKKAADKKAADKKK